MAIELFLQSKRQQQRVASELSFQKDSLAFIEIWKRNFTWQFQFMHG